MLWSQINIRITRRFILDGVDDDSVQSYGAKCLQSYIGMELQIKFDGEFVERLSSVQLINQNTKQNINDLLNEMRRSINADQLIRIPEPVGQNKMLNRHCWFY